MDGQTKIQGAKQAGEAVRYTNREGADHVLHLVRERIITAVKDTVTNLQFPLRVTGARPCLAGSRSVCPERQGPQFCCDGPGTRDERALHDLGTSSDLPSPSWTIFPSFLHLFCFVNACHVCWRETRMVQQAKRGRFQAANSARFPAALLDAGVVVSGRTLDRTYA